MTAGSARAILPPHTTRAEPQATPNIWKWRINTSRTTSLIARLVARLDSEDLSYVKSSENFEETLFDGNNL